MRAVGLMSGTSLDGIDAALVELEPHGEGYAWKLLGFASFPFPGRLATRVGKALPPNEPGPADVAALDALLGRAFGRAAAALAQGEPLDYVASHGLTLFHDGNRQRTVQIGDPYAIRERAQATVVFDFRRADCAAGGQGAPLVPFVDGLLFGGSAQATIALNLGGTANLSVLAAGAPLREVRAWDTGPGVMLLDAYVQRTSAGRELFDRDGELTARGRSDAATLERLLEDAYFELAPPKSTGRERFGDAFLARYWPALERLAPSDACATLAALTVEAIARDVARFGPPSARVIVSGGGVHNRALLRMLAERLGPAYEVLRSDALGIDPDAKEALAFAVLGYEALRGRPAGLPGVTGARHASVLGAIVPLRLAELLAKLQREVAAKR